MRFFSDDTIQVHIDDIEEPLHMHVPIVLKLATIHYYAVNTFSYIPMPLDFYERLLVDYHLVCVATTDVYDSHQQFDNGSSGRVTRDMVQLVLTVKGKEFLKKVPRARLVAALADHQFSPDRDWRWYRWYPYGEASNDVYCVAVSYMEGLSVSELPQFLSHEASTIRERAYELLNRPPNYAYI